jgi:hypothetical protein
MGWCYMRCNDCDGLDKKFMRPRTERNAQLFGGSLTPGIEMRLDSEESAALSAIQDHRIDAHRTDDMYE